MVRGALRGQASRRLLRVRVQRWLRCRRRAARARLSHSPLSPRRTFGLAGYWWRSDTTNRGTVGGSLIMTLQLRGHLTLPPHASGGFDHGDVHAATGRVFVAHTANNTVDVIDGERLEFVRGVGGCPEGSGVLCMQDADALVFAAARGAGKVLVLDATSCVVRNEIAVGPKPNGLAWDKSRRHLLVADVDDFSARLLEAPGGTTIASTP